MNHSLEWAIRCSHEASLYNHNYFVTLTYSDEFLPRGTYLNDVRSGELKESSLNRSDPQDFMKRLRFNIDRENLGASPRVFYSGEYGELLDRPHYHFLLFGMPDLTPGLEFYKRVGSFDVFNHPLIDKSWSFNPTRKSGAGILRGFATVQEFSFDTAAYTARYCLKKLTGKAVTLPEGDTLPEGLSLRLQPFVGMSNRPGIGADYYKAHPEIHDEDRTYYQKKFDLYSSKPPRYYDKMFDFAHGGNVDRWTETSFNGEIFSSEDDGQFVIDPEHVLNVKKRSFVTHSSEFEELSEARRAVSSERFKSDLFEHPDLEAYADQMRDLQESKQKKMHHAL